MTFYVDSSSFTSSTSFGTSAAFFEVGQNPGFNEFLTGLVDNVFVYNQSLSSSEIATIRSNGFASVPEPNSLVALTLGLFTILIGRHFLPAR